MDISLSAMRCHQVSKAIPSNVAGQWRHPLIVLGCIYRSLREQLHVNDAAGAGDSFVVMVRDDMQVDDYFSASPRRL